METINQSSGCGKSKKFIGRFGPQLRSDAVVVQFFTHLMGKRFVKRKREVYAFNQLIWSVEGQIV